MRPLLAIALLLAVLSGASTAHAQGSAPPRYRIDMSVYPYQRSVSDDVDYSAFINARITDRLSYFSFVNVKGLVTEGGTRFDRSEQNLRFALSKELPFDFNFQGVIVNGDGNDFYQLGVGWRIHNTAAWSDWFRKVGIIYRLTFQAARLDVDDEKSWGLEHFFRWNFTDDFYLFGFVDQVFDEQQRPDVPDNPIIAEFQFGHRIWKNIFVVGEYRVNDRRAGPRENIAAGLEAQFRW